MVAIYSGWTHSIVLQNFFVVCCVITTDQLADMITVFQCSQLHNMFEHHSHQFIALSVDMLDFFNTIFKMQHVNS